MEKQEKRFIERYGLEPVDEKEIINYELSAKDLRYFLDLFYEAKYLEQKYNSNLNSRVQLRPKLEDIYYRLNILSDLFNKQFKIKENRYDDNHDNLLYCNIDVLFKVMVKMMNEDEEKYDVKSIDYILTDDNGKEDKRNLFIISDKDTLQSLDEDIDNINTENKRIPYFYIEILPLLQKLVSEEKAFIVANKEDLSHHLYHDLKSFPCFDNSQNSYMYITCAHMNNKNFIGIIDLINKCKENYGDDFTNISEFTLLKSFQDLDNTEDFTKIYTIKNNK